MDTVMKMFPISKSELDIPNHLSNHSSYSASMEFYELSYSTNMVEVFRTFSTHFVLNKNKKRQLNFFTNTTIFKDFIEDLQKISFDYVSTFLIEG